jgi:TrpR family trp operon transcriptional repressor
MNKKAINELSSLFSRIKDAGLIEKFFTSILTRDEMNTIASRWELVKLLYQGESQRNISRKLNISLCKITRGSRELKKPGSPLRKVIDEYINNKK